jgi:hypothetical protein
VNELFTNSLKRVGRRTLPVECVVITTPNIEQINKIFCRMGVSYSISFVCATAFEDEFAFSEYMKAVYTFTRNFYAKLILGHPIRAAFLAAQA